MRVAVIGCGLIGRKRASSLPEMSKLVGCFDIQRAVAEKFAADFQTEYYSSIQELLEVDSIDFVIVATRHESLAEISELVLNAGLNVFVEKPGALSSLAFRSLAMLAREKQLRLCVGYNHRYHDAIAKALVIAKSAEFGEIMFIRGRYGHGGRIGYEKEWRANKALSGGGELIDQGSHLIDISLALLGDLEVDYAATPTYFWNMQVEDNAFLSLRNSNGNIAFLHTSWTEWKNKFSLEIYGKYGKLEVSGLGGSYGTETLTFYKMTPEMGPPLVEKWVFSGLDLSWKREMDAFASDLQDGSTFTDNLQTSTQVLDLIERAYRGSH